MPIKKDIILQTRTALSCADDVEASVLIMNGQADPQGVPLHALNMAAELSGLGKEYELIIMERGNHILSGRHTERRDQEVLKWFKKYLNLTGKISIIRGSNGMEMGSENTPGQVNNRDPASIPVYCSK